MDNSALDFLDCICFPYNSIYVLPHGSHFSKSHYNRSLIEGVNQHSFGVPLSGNHNSSKICKTKTVCDFLLWLV